MDKTHLDLLYANKVKEVDEIIQGHSGMSDASNWCALDGRETNFNVIRNQSKNGGKAATELITNMVDAMLTKCCKEEGIDPTSKDAPQTMYDAVDKFVMQLNGGKIIKADGTDLRKYAAKNLIIGVVGSKSSQVRPCYVFCDNGEGQHPCKFPDTFLSLKAKNKSEIPFVQGKYNMGSSGVLMYCGNMYKLIISRCYDQTGEWGWTLIRKNKSKGESYAEYYRPQNKIESVGKEPIFPFQLGTGKRFNQFSIETGTIIKLYEYYTGKKHTGFQGARDAFNENLVETILPFRILDFRQKPDPGRGEFRGMGIDPRPLYGLEYLLARPHEEDKEEDEFMTADDVEGGNIHVDTIQDKRLGKIVITAIKLKKPIKDRGADSIQGRVFHHVNGQVQYKRARGFLTQCKLPLLKDRVVIFVDASMLTSDARQQIWKGDREDILETDEGDLYKDTVKSSIERSDKLKSLNYKIAKEEIASAAKDSSRELVEELVKKDKNFALLLDGLIPDVSSPLPPPSPPPPRSDLKYDPTYVKLVGRKHEFNVVPGRRRTIECNTDAKDDFLTRADNRGNLLFSDDEMANIFQCNANLENGELSVSIRTIAEVNVGNEYKFNIVLDSESMSSPVQTDEITIKIVESQKTDPRPTPPPSPPSPPSKRGLPPHGLITKDGRNIDGNESITWEEAGGKHTDFNEKDGGYASDLGDGSKKYWINYDNSSFQSYLGAQKNDATRKAVSEKYVLGMQILMLGLEHALGHTLENVPDEKKEKLQENDFEDNFRRMAAKGSAFVVLTLCDQLPKNFDAYMGRDEADES